MVNKLLKSFKTFLILNDLFPAIATGFMALGMMLPGMVSGFIQEALGYTGFFIWVAIAAIPALILAKLIDYPSEYGKKETE